MSQVLQGYKLKIFSVYLKFSFNWHPLFLFAKSPNLGGNYMEGEVGNGASNSPAALQEAGGEQG